MCIELTKSEVISEDQILLQFSKKGSRTGSWIWIDQRAIEQMENIMDIIYQQAVDIIENHLHTLKAS